MPFGRLVRAMDEWSAANPAEPVFAQIGSGSYEPEHMDWARMLSPTDYNAKIAACRVVVAHAGVGSYLKAASNGRPLVLLPRQKSLNEHTTDHQMATARWIEARNGVFLAWTETELGERIAAARQYDGSVDAFSNEASGDFIAKLSSYISNGCRG